MWVQNGETHTLLLGRVSAVDLLSQSCCFVGSARWSIDGSELGVGNAGPSPDSVTPATSALQSLASGHGRVLLVQRPDVPVGYSWLLPRGSSSQGKQHRKPVV